jgi:hypothetical protein
VLCDGTEGCAVLRDRRRRLNVVLPAHLGSHAGQWALVGQRHWGNRGGGEGCAGVAGAVQGGGAALLEPLERGLALALACLRRSLAAFLARDGGAAVCVLGCFAPNLGQEVVAPASGCKGAAWRPDPAEEEDVGAAAPGVRAFSSQLRHERVWREATRREVLRCGLLQWWWWWVAACCRVFSATRVWRIGGDDFGFGELRVKALQ